MAQLEIEMLEQTGHIPFVKVNEQEPDLSTSEELMNQFKQDRENDEFIQARILIMESNLEMTSL